VITDAPPAWRHASAAAWVAAAVMAASVALSVVRLPVQLTDSLVPLLQVNAETSTETLRRASQEDGFLRPAWWLQVGWLLDVAGERVSFAFRGFHVALIALLFGLVTLVARVRTVVDVVAFVFMLTVLVGMYTFLGSVWEAYPINHYLEVSVAALATLALARSRGGWWADAAACGLFVVAVLTL
jgi:hypothetical protein